MLADQRDMAVRVADAGAGLWLDKTRFSAASLREAIEHVLEDESYAGNIPAVQAAMDRAGGVKRAADLIERMAYCSGGLCYQAPVSWIFARIFSARSACFSKRVHAASLFSCSSVIRCVARTAEMTSRARGVST